MPDRDLHREAIPAEIQEIVRTVVSSMRAVKLYPPNNPVYSQSVLKSFEILERYLASHPAFPLRVQKTGFSCNHAPVGGDVHLYKGIASDLFAKGIREIIFGRGISKTELLNFYTVIAIPQEELKLKNTIQTLLWEKGVSHITVKEAALDEVMLQEYDSRPAGGELTGERPGADALRERLKSKEIDLFGRKMMLVDLLSDPSRFGAMMVEMAKQTADSPTLRENRLFDLYREMGRQLLHISYHERSPLFDALAESILGMDPEYKEGLIAGKLYRELDTETILEQKTGVPEQVPDNLHELISARFFKSWTVPQVSVLLEKTSSAQFSPAAPDYERSHAIQGLYAITQEMSEYTPEEMEALKALSDFGTEEGIVEAVARTLIYVLPQVRNPFSPGSPEKQINLFSGVVGHLEEILLQLLEKKDYVMAVLILRTFRIPVDALFQPRLANALKKAGDKKIIVRLMDDIRRFSKDSPEYQAVYSYFSLLDREVTPVLLEMLAEEEDRSARNLLIRILKDLGKNQIAVLGARLSDERWYFVRNIVNILGESRKETVISYLEKVADHKSFQIRQEVARALLSIGGEKAAELMARFLYDRDIDIRFMAVRGLGMLHVPGEKVEQALLDFLKTGTMKKIDPELKAEAIESLGKIGGLRAARLLMPFTKLKWWRPRKPQEKLKAAAEKAIREIERRMSDAGRAKERTE